MAHWKHNATRCAVEGCERTRVKGRTTCGLIGHYEQGVSLYGLRPGEPRLKDAGILDAERCGSCDELRDREGRCNNYNCE